MGDSPSDLRRTLGGAARLWASPEHHAVSSQWWVALSGEKSVTYNVACCQSADADALTDRCLQPLVDLGQPATIMLAGSGLATAQTLADLGWVTVGALPLMVLAAPSKSDDDVAVRGLSPQDLPAARELLADTYGLDPSSAIAAIPDLAELNIGHFLIGEAIFSGLAHSVKAMRMAIDEGAAMRAARQ